MDDFIVSLTCEEYYYYDEDLDDYDHSIRRPLNANLPFDSDDDW